MADAVVVVVALATQACCSLRLLLRHPLVSGKVRHQDLLVLKHLPLQVLQAVARLRTVALAVASTATGVARGLLLLLHALTLVLKQQAALGATASVLSAGSFPLLGLVGALTRFVHFVHQVV